MRNFYLLVYLLCCAQILNAQTAELGPLLGNPALRILDAKQQAHIADDIQHLTGFNPFTGLMPESLEDCDDNYGFDLVEEGGEIFLNIDTIGLGGGIFGDSLIINTACGLSLAEEVFITGISLQYTAALFTDNADVKQDTVCVDYYQNQGEVIPLRIPVTIRRKGREIMLPSELIQPNSTAEFCIDQSDLQFPTAVQCGEIADVLDDGYDGNGVAPRFFFQTSELCFSYTSNAFPGTDEVAVTLCDELGICDVFIIPIQVPGITILPVGNQIFFDDFSYVGPYPDPNLWIEDRVFINNTYAYNPPSVGVATFDGLDRSGTPYDIDFSGVGDRLTSQLIDLSGFTDDDDIYLKFFIQRKGYGLAPNFTDSMFVEFKDNDGDWKLAEGGYTGFASGVGFNYFEPFQFKAIHIEDDELFHNKFQFRFSSVVSSPNSPIGVSDLWHLDYVSLQVNSDTSRVFDDVAFTQAPTSVLSRYRSMPWSQFSFMESEAQELQPELIAEFFNHKNETENFDQSNVRIKELETNSIFSDVFPLDVQNIPGQSRLNKARSMETANVYSSFINFMKNIDPGVDEKRVLEISYDFSADQDNLYLRNDKVSAKIIFDDYFAYDDGSPESQAFIQNGNGGEEMAQKYSANMADEITAVKFLFPYVNGDVTGQEFQWRIYDQNPNTKISDPNDPTGQDSILVLPIYESAVLNPFFVDVLRDTLLGFTTYRVEDADGEPMSVPIEAGDFWISFVQLTSIQKGIPIGFDRNASLPPFTNLVRIGSTFNDYGSSQGALMMNPIMGGHPFNAPTTEVRTLRKVMNIYPNPAGDEVFINLLEGNYQDYQVEIYNNIGQLVRTIQLDNQLSVEDFNSGLYLFKIFNVQTLETFQEKLLIVK